jgi:hypothetical protein
MKPEPTILNGQTLTTDGDLHIYELRHPSDHTKNGLVKAFRDPDPDSADERARKFAARENCGLVRKAVL